MAKSELSNEIRRLRFEHGEMTQQDLADRAKVTRQTIIALEAGRYVPSLLLAFRIARVFDVKVDDLIPLEWQDTEISPGLPPLVASESAVGELLRSAS